MYTCNVKNVYNISFYTRIKNVCISPGFIVAFACIYKRSHFWDG